jgi:hypothetical protein
MEYAAMSLLKSWNLLDIDTGEPADITAWDALEHVPTDVTDQIMLKTQDIDAMTEEETKNS